MPLGISSFSFFEAKAILYEKEKKKKKKIVNRSGVILSMSKIGPIE